MTGRQTEGTGSPPVVRTFAYWDTRNCLKATPGRTGLWRGIQFVPEEPGPADYVVVYDHSGRTVDVECPPENVWLVLNEPPDETHRMWHHPPTTFRRVFTSDESIRSSRHVLTPLHLPWHLGKDFDYLVARPGIEKVKPLSWITSNRTDNIGHRRRMSFLQAVVDTPQLDLYGRGFRPLADKWDGLAPYRYSIAYENFENDHYWTEKVADCLLAWTMPIYFGCRDLSRFLPRRSYVQLDPEWRDPVGELKRIVESDVRERNLDAISEARQLLLHEYNWFELIASTIRRAHRRENECGKRRKMSLRDHTNPRGRRLRGWCPPLVRRFAKSILDAW